MGDRGSQLPYCHNIVLRVMRLESDVALPSYAHAGDAGLDLRALSGVSLSPGGGRATVATGLALELDPGAVGLIMPRSGLASSHGVTVLNSPGVIDSGYRGEIKVVLVNLDPISTYEVRAGDRIAQLVVIAASVQQIIEVAQLTESSRGLHGFGQSGI